MEDNTFKIYESDDIGEVRVTEEVIAIIAGLAATEVEGVASLAGNLTNEIIAKLGRKNLSSGVDVVCTEGEVSVNLSVVLEMGFGILDVSKNIQERVKEAIEGMTGMKVASVDINISNVKVED